MANTPSTTPQDDYTPITRDEALASPRVTEYPKLTAGRKADIVESHGSRQALGGVVNAIVVHPDESRTVFGPGDAWGGDDGLKLDAEGKALTRGSALQLARKGVPAPAPAASE